MFSGFHFLLFFVFLPYFLEKILGQLPQQSLWEETFTVVFLKMFMFILCLIIGSLEKTSFLQSPLCSVIWLLIIGRHVWISSCSLVLESFPCSHFYWCRCDKYSDKKQLREERTYFSLQVQVIVHNCRGIKVSATWNSWSHHPQIVEKNECLIACA